MVVLDSLLTMVLFFGIIFHVLEDEFATLNDKVIESIIGICLPIMSMIYAFIDGVRFLNNTFDKLLYLLSCTVMHKPILIPIMCPSRFKSQEAT